MKFFSSELGCHDFIRVEAAGLYKLVGDVYETVHGRIVKRELWECRKQILAPYNTKVQVTLQYLNARCDPKNEITVWIFLYQPDYVIKFQIPGLRGLSACFGQGLATFKPLSPKDGQEYDRLNFYSHFFFEAFRRLGDARPGHSPAKDDTGRTTGSRYLWLRSA